MSGRIYKNAKILTGRNLDLIEGYIRVQDGVIADIGEGEPTEFDVDVKGGFIMPSFVDSHTHLGDSVRTEIYHGCNQPKVVSENGRKFEALEESTEKERIEAIKEVLQGMKKQGILTHLDFREGGAEGANLFKKAQNNKINSILLSRPSEFSNLEELLSISDGIGLPSFGLYTTKELEEISELMAGKDKFLSSHVSETRKAHEKSLEKTGKTEIQRAVDYGADFLIHGTWAESDDLALMSERDIPLVLCPRANSLLSVGIPPIREALEKGVPLWLGTDNVSVCYPSMFRELSFSWAALRLQSDKAGIEEARELLKASTVNPMSRLELPFGPIREDERAAFLVLSADWNLRHCENPYLGIVNRVSAANIREVYRPPEKN